MRYKAIFAAGFAAGFVAGARAGRGAYDKIASAAQSVAGNSKVQQATSAAQAKATDLAKTAASKAPEAARSAASSAAKTAQTQVPKLVANAKEAATSKLPPRFGGSSVTDDVPDAAAASTVGPDGHLMHPTDGDGPSVNGSQLP